MSSELANLSKAIENVIDAPRPQIHPGRMSQVQFPVQHAPMPTQPMYPSPYQQNHYPQHPHPHPQPPQPQQPIPAPPPPQQQHKTFTYIGHTREMEFSYDVDGAGREYHHVHDFDIHYKSVGLDYLPLDGLFLALQHSKERFVAAFLMINQRDVIGIITRSQNPQFIHHEGKHFVHLSFAAGVGYNGNPGLHLASCNNTTFTVRVIVAERAGTNFFLMLEGYNYPQGEITKVPFYSHVHWSGAQQQSVLVVKNGRVFTNILLHWVPQQHGPANLDKNSNNSNRKRSRNQVPESESHAVVLPKPTLVPTNATAPVTTTPEEYDPTNPSLVTSDEYDPTSPGISKTQSPSEMSVAEEAQRIKDIINTPYNALFEPLHAKTHDTIYSKRR